MGELGLEDSCSFFSCLTMDRCSFRPWMLGVWIAMVTVVPWH